MWSDPIADLLTRIRNAVRNGSAEVRVPRSLVKLSICRVLQEEGYILGVDEIDDGKHGLLRVRLKYGPRGEQVITELKRVSKAGCRRYAGSAELPRVQNGMGISIVSTSRGMMSDRRCRELKVGGEVICTVV